MKPVSQLLKSRDNTLWHARPQDTVFDALKLLAEHEVGALAVMEGSQLVGVFSERDYTRKVALQGRSSKETRVREVISGRVVVVAPATPIPECMRLMTSNRIRHLPVVADGRQAHPPHAVGIVFDLLPGRGPHVVTFDHGPQPLAGGNARCRGHRAHRAVRV